MASSKLRTVIALLVSLVFVAATSLAGSAVRTSGGGRAPSMPRPPAQLIYPFQPMPRIERPQPDRPRVGSYDNDPLPAPGTAPPAEEHKGP